MTVGDERESEGGEGHAEDTAFLAAEAVQRLLGPPTMRRLDVADNTGIPPELTRSFWQALGFPTAPEEETRYTEADQAAILRTVEILSTGRIDQEMGLAMTRAIARSVDRLASWLSSLAMESVRRHEVGEQLHLRPPDPATPESKGSDLPANLKAILATEREGDERLWNHELSPQASQQAGELLLSLVEDVEPLLIYAWRRHLAATIGRLMTNDREIEGTGSVRTVGFADMVGFTTLVRRLSERQLAQLVDRFEAIAGEVIAAHGGRIVKTLGDEVVFVAYDPAAGAAIGLDLLERIGADQGMPDLRVGLALGPVLSHLGDVFGTTVNRASRLTNVARTRTVVIDDALAQSISGVEGFEVSRLPPRALRGIGMTVVWHLSRAHPQAGPVDTTLTEGEIDPAQWARMTQAMTHATWDATRRQRFAADAARAATPAVPPAPGAASPTGRATSGATTSAAATSAAATSAAATSAAAPAGAESAPADSAPAESSPAEPSPAEPSPAESATAPSDSADDAPVIGPAGKHGAADGPGGPDAPE